MKVDEFVGVNRIDQGQGGNLMVHGWPLEQCGREAAGVRRAPV